MYPPLIRARPLLDGAKVGVFTPSFPANVSMRDKYLHGLGVLRSCGFDVVEGWVTQQCMSQGYRSASPADRAAEIMELVLDPTVSAVIATIGGANSASLIPYLDFDAIRSHPKIWCGYSDVTSLHLAVLRYAGLATFYGPAIVPSFGEWPTILPETLASFRGAVQGRGTGRAIERPKQWSNHFRNGLNRDWCTIPRQFQENDGWKVLRHGAATAPVLVANLNTLVSAAGTDYFPNVAGKILFIEEMDARMSRLERSLRQLHFLGVFDEIRGLVFSKAEIFDAEGSPFSFEQLLMEILADAPEYPIVTGFDCGHTQPMITLAQMTQISLVATEGELATFTINESMTA